MDSCSLPNTKTGIVEKEVDLGTQKNESTAKTLLRERAEKFASEEVEKRTREIAELARNLTAQQSPEAQAAMGEHCESIIYQVGRDVSPAPARTEDSGYSIQEIAGETATMAGDIPMGTSSWGVYQDGIFKEGFSVTSYCLPAWTVSLDERINAEVSDLKMTAKTQGKTVDSLDLAPVLTDNLIDATTRNRAKRESTTGEVENCIDIFYAPAEAN